MAKGFILVPTIQSSSVPSNLIVNSYGIDGYFRPTSSTVGYKLLGYSANTNLEAMYCFLYTDSSYDYSMPCYVSLTNDSYRIASAALGSTSGDASVHNLTASRSYDGAQLWLNNDFSNRYGWWPTALTQYEPYASLEEGFSAIVSGDYASISVNSGAVEVAIPKLVVRGSTVTGYVTAPRGVTVTDSDITVTKQGVTVPFTYSNGVLTFTA